jgi:hypothetical protein
MGNGSKLGRPMSARERPPERDPESVSEAAKRLAAIVEAAEEAASGVIDDAEEQARQRLEEADTRADRLVAAKLRALADELDPPGGEDRPAPHLRPVQPVEVDAEPPSRRSESAGARLLATQMAVSGASRAEIEQRLRNGFQIEDASEILDAILGPGD